MEHYYVGRQPILDQQYKTVAYELLFRAADSPRNPASDAEMTAQVLVGGLMDLGIDKLSGNLPVYIKASREMLLDGIAAQFPPEILGIQLPFDMPGRGHSIMLNGFPTTPGNEAWLDIVDSIKLDMQGDTDLPGIVDQLRPHTLRLVEGKTLPDSKLSVLQAMRQVMAAEAISDEGCFGQTLFAR